MPRQHDPREIKDILNLDDIEQSRDHPEHLRPDEEGGVIHRPPRQDPRGADQSVLPGHDDVPAGISKSIRRMPPR
jgi:hypothetical protein